MIIYGQQYGLPFKEVWEDEDEFIEDYEDSVFYTSASTKEKLDEDHEKLLYGLLMARFANSAVMNDSTSQFKEQVFAIIFQYGPTWQERLALQEKIRNLSDADIMKGGKAIYNHAAHPGTTPSTATLTELTAIDDQNTTNYTKSQLEAYSLKWEMINNDVTNAFLDKFQKLFNPFAGPVTQAVWNNPDYTGD